VSPDEQYKHCIEDPAGNPLLILMSAALCGSTAGLLIMAFLEAL
jgi:hypothetical protein